MKKIRIPRKIKKIIKNNNPHLGKLNKDDVICIHKTLNHYKKETWGEWIKQKHRLQTIK